MNCEGTSCRHPATHRVLVRAALAEALGAPEAPDVAVTKHYCNGCTKRACSREFSEVISLSPLAQEGEPS